jgi:hypothetical protein
VRNDFFLTKDGCKSDLYMWLTDAERDYSIDDADFDAWWAAVGQRAVIKKAVTARAALMTRVKEFIWRHYSARQPTCTVMPHN